MTDTRIFRGFAADGSKLYEAPRCTYCGMEGHRASHCKQRVIDGAYLAEAANSKVLADFAALAEPDCAHYCRGECDPMGATCWKGHKPRQIAEPDAGEAYREADWRYVLQAVAGLIGAVAVVGLVLKAIQAGVA